MPDIKNSLIASAKEHFDVPGFANDVIDEIGMPALKKVVADTKNPFDDMLLATAGPAILTALKNELANYWDKLQVES